MTKQELLQCQIDVLCESIHCLLVVPNLLRWQEAGYERQVNFGKAEVMHDLRNLVDILESKVLVLIDKTKLIEQTLFDIEAEKRKKNP